MKRGREKAKMSIYLPVEVVEEIQREAARQQRPQSWIIERAWKLSRDAIATIPGVDDLDDKTR